MWSIDKIDHVAQKKILVLLFHRYNLTPPIHVSTENETRMTIRQVNKEPGEVQALSAHMLISLSPVTKNR